MIPQDEPVNYLSVPMAPEIFGFYICKRCFNWREIFVNQRPEY